MLTKKIFAVSLLVLTILFTGQFAARAQSRSGSLYAEPEHLTLKNEEKDMKAVEEVGRGGKLRAAFYPIGWSKDGKFAFYVEPPDEECGCYFAHFVIQDLKNDRVLWEQKYDSQNGGPETLADYWKKNQKEFSAKLAEHGIVAQTRFSLLDSSFQYEKDTFTVQLTDTTKTDDELFYARGDVALRLISKAKGKKTIYARKFNPKEMTGFLGAEFSGALLSPFEPRAAVIMSETLRGWEGPPHTTRLRIVGATLTTGFQ